MDQRNLLKKYIRPQCFVHVLTILIFQALDCRLRVRMFHICDRKTSKQTYVMLRSSSINNLTSFRYDIWRVIQFPLKLLIPAHSFYHVLVGYSTTL
jgi:hypothetical protein